jgi:hypothetical protein
VRLSEESGLFGAPSHQHFRTKAGQTIGVIALQWYVWVGHSRRKSHSEDLSRHSDQMDAVLGPTANEGAHR